MMPYALKRGDTDELIKTENEGKINVTRGMTLFFNLDKKIDSFIRSGKVYPHVL